MKNASNKYQEKWSCQVAHFPFPFSDVPFWVFRWFLHIMQFVTPFIIIVFSYISIMIKLKKRARNQPESRTETQIHEDNDRTARVNKMLMAMVFIFGICWFPSKFIFIYYDIIAWVNCSNLFYLFLYISHVIACSSTCYNPFLYGFMNPAFRTEFAKLFSRDKNIATTEKQDFESPTILTETELVQVESIKEVS